MKVHERNLHQGEIVIDLSLSYFGDAELSFWLHGIQGGIKNVELLGTLRIVLKNSMANAQLLEAVEISFLECPTYDFELTTALAPLNTSGELLHSIIKEQLSERLVFPNKISIKVNDSADSNEMPEINGVIRIAVLDVRELSDSEDQMLSMIIVQGDQFSQSFDSKVYKEGIAVFNAECYLVKYADNDDDLNITVNINGGSEESKSLNGNINLSNLLTIGKVAGSFSLKPQGSISVGLTWYTLSTERKYLRIKPFKSSSLLEVFVDSVKNLTKNKYVAYVDLSIENQVQQTTVLAVDSLSWKKHFTFFLNDPEFETLTVKLIDRLTSNELGYFTYNISDLMMRLQMEDKMQAFPLIKGIDESEIVMSLKLRVLKSPSQ